MVERKGFGILTRSPVPARWCVFGKPPKVSPWCRNMYAPTGMRCQERHQLGEMWSFNLKASCVEVSTESESEMITNQSGMCEISDLCFDGCWHHRISEWRNRDLKQQHAKSWGCGLQHTFLESWNQHWILNTCFWCCPKLVQIHRLVKLRSTRHLGSVPLGLPHGHLSFFLHPDPLINWAVGGLDVASKMWYCIIYDDIVLWYCCIKELQLIWGKLQLIWGWISESIKPLFIQLVGCLGGSHGWLLVAAAEAIPCQKAPGQQVELVELVLMGTTKTT